MDNSFYFSLKPISSILIFSFLDGFLLENNTKKRDQPDSLF